MNSHISQRFRKLSRRDLWKKLGVGSLGLIGGFLLGIIVQDILATIFMRTGTTTLNFIFAILVPVFAVIGAFIAILLETRTRVKKTKQSDRGAQ